MGARAMIGGRAMMRARMHDRVRAFFSFSVCGTYLFACVCARGGARKRTRMHVCVSAVCVCMKGRERVCARRRVKAMHACVDERCACAEGSQVRGITSNSYGLCSYGRSFDLK